MFCNKTCKNSQKFNTNKMNISFIINVDVLVCKPGYKSVYYYYTINLFKSRLLNINI